MVLWARSDVMSVTIPETSGGCGKTHSRPVSKGIPEKQFDLHCDRCEPYLRGDRKRKVIKVIPGDKDKQIPSRMEHVADADPFWSTSPEGIPETPDELSINAIRRERAQRHLAEMAAVAALKQAGMPLPEDVSWMLAQDHDPRIIKGAVFCPRGHTIVADANFCPICGAAIIHESIKASNELPETTPLEDVIPLARLNTLHIATLKKMCRERDLSDKGKKAELIERLMQ